MVWRLVCEGLSLVFPALIVAVILLFLAQPRRLEGPSMEPNLHVGQRLFVERVSYLLRSPRRGDIVVLNLPARPGDSLIKRAIALAGETIEIRDGQVFINGQPLEEPYVHFRSSDSMPPYVVPTNAVFVMGDNRGFSNDSRAFGPVPLSALRGRAWFRYWPPNRIGLLR